MNCHDYLKEINKVQKTNKYSAKKKLCNHEHLHDSVKEANRCDELHLILKSGQITDLEIQKRFLIIPALYETKVLNEVYKKGALKGQRKTQKVCVERAVEYIADFVYFDKALEKVVIEDSKGMRTKDYVLKRKLMKQQYCQNDKTIFIET